jgi:hypothetical protein
VTRCTAPASDPIQAIHLTRTSRSSITFAAPFRLQGLALPQAAGTYRVDTYEECVEGMHPTVYRPVATHLYLRVGGSVRIRAVDSRDLRAAWEQDPIRQPATRRMDRIFLSTEGSCT